MKIATFANAPIPARQPLAASKPPQPPQRPDGFEPGPHRDNWKPVAVLTAAAGGGGALGVYAGLHGGLTSELLALAAVPGLAITGALVGGIAAEAFGNHSDQYRAIGGGILGGLAGGAAGITQAFFAGGSGSPALAATLGVSGVALGLGVLFQVATHKH